MCEDNKKLRCEDAEVLTQRLICLQKSILGNEALMAGIGLKRRYNSAELARDVYDMSRYLYEHSVEYAKNRIDS